MEMELIVILVAGLVTGFSKFSVGGMGLLILPIIMIAYPGPQALGIILPMYLITDVLAIISYRRQINWAILAKLLPLCFIGVVVGGWVLSFIDSSQFSLMLGVLILAMLLLGFVIDRTKASFMQHPLSTAIVGFIGGFVSAVSNAAGPIFSLYFMEQKLSKLSYVSTRSWAFMLINLTKVPVLLSIGLMNLESTIISLQAIPGLVIGALLGYWLLKKIKLSQFKMLIRIMASIAAVKLIV